MRHYTWKLLPGSLLLKSKCCYWWENDPFLVFIVDINSDGQNTEHMQHLWCANAVGTKAIIVVAVAVVDNSHGQNTENMQHLWCGDEV